jgi:hypothetical protein
MRRAQSTWFSAKKIYELPSPTNWSAKNSAICRLEQIQIWFDGNNQKQDDEKVFTVRFTVKTIRLGATDVDIPR